MVLHACADLGYQLKDLHWKNIGITADQALIIFDFEICQHSPGERPSEKYDEAVARRHTSFRGFLQEHGSTHWAPNYVAMCGYSREGLVEPLPHLVANGVRRFRRAQEYSGGDFDVAASD
ncbi:unnamed protein product [Prorocentrum cordatum]|uniref:Protein kinase domain-containing protein n=1 Tax=Prorocentrum cordatum TaxID=2364126 RepID=A0ABN9U8N0_9DINO|nr:unnamed protein product [Polarella glacialis]